MCTEVQVLCTVNIYGRMQRKSLQHSWNACVENFHWTFVLILVCVILAKVSCQNISLGSFGLFYLILFVRYKEQINLTKSKIVYVYMYWYCSNNIWTYFDIHCIKKYFYADTIKEAKNVLWHVSPLLYRLTDYQD
jgi:hypothetical protein